MESGSPGLAAAACPAETALFRASMTIVNVSCSCFKYPLAVSTRLGIKSYRRLSCTSICEKAFSYRFLNPTRRL